MGGARVIVYRLMEGGIVQGGGAAEDEEPLRQLRCHLPRKGGRGREEVPLSRCATAPPAGERWSPP